MSNLGKVVSGGWFTLVLAATFFTLLYLYNKARELRTSITEYESMKKVIPLLSAVKKDEKIPFDATNIVFLTRSNSPNKLDTTVFHSLFNKKPQES